MAKGVQLKGGNQAKLVLQALQKNLDADTLRKNMRKGAKVIADEARQNTNATDPSGELGKAVGVINDPDDRTGVQVAARRGKRYEKGYIAHIVEYGAAPHIIRAKKGKKLAFKHGDKTVVVDEVSHPGIKARPFMRPAWETKKDAALNRIKEGLKKEIGDFGSKYKKAKMR
ncbi:HK97 gp10 family phage protein [Pontibacter ummariensis]|uniref:Phage protein, HK97 gp10 family n=1 Tax=Pontibacter ummariensis TaxID=1610492 RepID=A0A239HJ25_9BACT|nr:HK97 gp10 family phage protein [Pontibacter ummariensis]PRY10286.1 HK97 gp10 family phage protein [Pontibacter ummariensis]SNS81426.1 phage protein, HK97 gp10 family [Pontibacter ummariensis]